ncbi:phage portal protein [Aeromonas enteropelogenes]|uniref:phage portal protein n=1 Tax=Aeromonas enteropelogenes TaxID=29489 RepID=UPI0022853F08|nr:phage portal protein [Aeromonas enteropelogenes]MCZ0751137.1 phage portal protein [Aeromonas enteropelogenes]
MNRKQRYQARRAAPHAESGSRSAVTFSIPEAVDPTAWMTDYTDVFYSPWGEYYMPPIDRQGLAKIARANAHHGAILMARRNMVSGRFAKSEGTPRDVITAFVHNLLQFGDAALLTLRNGFGQVVGLYPLSGLYIRRCLDGSFLMLQRDGSYKYYAERDIIWLAQYDPVQQVYGQPDYLGGLQSALLNQDATMFRRKYFLNGAHMGFIFYATDPNMDDEQEDEMKEMIASSKGVGNFRSMFVNIPNGKPDGIKLIPVGDIATKDEFAAIKAITAQDVLTAHRFPAALAGIIPANGSAGLGNPEQYDRTYARNETIPMCELIADAINGAGLPRRFWVDFNRSLEEPAAA